MAMMKATDTKNITREREREVLVAACAFLVGCVIG